MYLKYIIPSILIAAYLFTRLYNILLLPIFNDEAIYIRFAQIIAGEADALFVPLAQPNKPLFMWINALIYDLFDNPLLAGRSISVVAGLGSMAGLYMIGKDNFSRRAGLGAAIIYIILPYTLIFDRMAHVDSLLNLFNIWFIYVVLRVFHEAMPFKKGAVIAGILAGGAFLTKSSALLFLLMPVFFLPFVKLDKEKVFFIVIAYALCFILFIPVLLADQQPLLSGGDKVVHNVNHMLTVQELIALPIQTWWNNWLNLSGYFIQYVSLPILILSLYGFFVCGSLDFKKGLMFFIWFIFAPLTFLLIAQFSYSRWLLFCSSPLIIMAGVGAETFTRSFIKWSGAKKVALTRACLSALFVLFCFPSIHFGYKLLREPVHAPWVKADREQYIRNEFSGYGIRELVAFLKAAGKINPAMVLVTNNWGNPSDALFLYLEKEQNIEIYESWWWTRYPIVPKKKRLIKVLTNKYLGKGVQKELPTNDRNIFFVCSSFSFPQREFSIRNPDFRLVGNFTKPGGEAAFHLYKWVGRTASKQCLKGFRH